MLVTKERLNIRPRAGSPPPELAALAGDHRVLTVRWGPHQVRLGPVSVWLEPCGCVVGVLQR